MLILIAVIVAIVAIAATQLIGTAKKSSSQAGEQSQDLLDKSAKAIKAKTGEFCIKDNDCISNKCTCPDSVCSGSSSSEYACE